MRYKVVAAGIGLVMLIIPLGLTLPILTGLLYGEPLPKLFLSFALPGIAVAVLGMISFSRGRELVKNLRPLEALVIVSAGWVLIAAVGALPFIIWGTIPNYVDAFFESMSGFTTTGASVITEIDGLPRSILLWRALTQWLGGLGVIVLMVALFSAFMGGPKAGMLLMKGEVPGHKSDKVVSRIKDTAKLLWVIYVVLTISEVILLTILGLSLYDAVCHTFTTLSTGGYGTHTTSIAHYRDLSTAPLIEMVFTFFMFVGGVNFVLHYNFIAKGVRSYLRDREFKVYAGIMAGLWLLVAADLALNRSYSPGESMRMSVFTITSMQTTTGYVVSDYQTWPAFSQFIIIVAMFLGGMTGSTGGGMKIARLIIANNALRRSIRAIGHPSSHLPLRVSSLIIPEGIVRSVGLFIFGYLMLFLTGTFLVSLTGPDIVTSLSAVAATLGNVGPGLGLVGPTANYASLTYSAKVMLTALMWLGRLELLTCLVLLLPSTYRS